MPLAIYVLSLGAFVVCTSEFVIMGLLPAIATNLHVSLASTGLLVTGYALGVVVGAPLLTPFVSRRSPRPTLVGLMILFLAGNLACGLAPTYAALLAFRLITAFAHASFFGIGAVVAGRLAPAGKEARAIAGMFLGATLATILGVPVGTALGQVLGWRSIFLAIAGVAVLAAICIARFIPDLAAERDIRFRDEVAILLRPRMARALATTVLGNGGPFVLFTYITPFLTQVWGIKVSALPFYLFLFGAGMVVGNPVGGWLADHDARRAPRVAISFLIATLILCAIISPEPIQSGIAMLLFGAATFAVIPPLQGQVLKEAREAPTLASATNIAAFNLGNAAGAFIGSIVVAGAWGLRGLPWAAIAFAAIGLLLSLWTSRAGRTVRPPQSAGACAAARSCQEDG